jgi:hypothetical protein
MSPLHAFTLGFFVGLVVAALFAWATEEDDGGGAP